MTTTAQDMQDIYERFKLFTDGYRVLFLIHRSKEGGKSANNDHVRKIITRDAEEWQAGLLELLNDKYRASLEGKQLRIYATVNKRNVEKAVRSFKYAQLDADYYGDNERLGFYHDIKNRWISALMQQANRADSLFLFDIDRPDIEAVKTELDAAAKAGGATIGILHTYKTRNGWHMVTTPFNPNIVHIAGVEINKDGLLLLSY